MTGGHRPGLEPYELPQHRDEAGPIGCYFNESKINLSPAFQRGPVWKVGTRRKLIANIVQSRPIPAIFLYKEASGARYEYNILDGKQRLESILLFIGEEEVGGLGVRTFAKYFFPAEARSQRGFWIELPSGKTTFEKLSEQNIRDLREYSIPTVEITLGGSSHLDEIISLFVDINQQGTKVTRFQIAKAVGQENPLLDWVFKLLAIKQKRYQDTWYKAKSSVFTKVLKRLDIVASATDGNAKVDRMWERMLEIVLFKQSLKHRNPVDILKSFIAVRASRMRGSRHPPAPMLQRSVESLGLSTRRIERRGWGTPHSRPTRRTSTRWLRRSSRTT